MKNLNPTIELEQILGGQIYDALQGGVVEAVLKKAKLNSGDEYWRSNMEGHSIKITKPLLGIFMRCAMRLRRDWASRRLLTSMCRVTRRSTRFLWRPLRKGCRTS